MNIPSRPLGSQRVLMVGDLDEHSSAWRLARQVSVLGARLALLCPSAGPAHRAAASLLDARLLVGDLADRPALEAMVQSAADHLGGFDLVVFSIDWAPCASPGRGDEDDEAISRHLQQLRASCRSFSELARLCAEHMPQGASLVRLDAAHVARASISNELMRAVQAVLESIVRYLRLELQPWGLEVHGVSSAPMVAQLASRPLARAPGFMHAL